MTGPDAQISPNLGGLLTPEATPDNVRPYAFQARRRAEFHRSEAERLDAFADALYRWIAKQGSRP